MHKKIVALGALALLFGIREANAESPEPTSTHIFFSVAFKTIEYDEDIKKLPEELKKQVANASPKEIDEWTIECFKWINKYNYQSTKLLLRELFKKNPGLSAPFFRGRYNLKKMNNVAFFLLDIDPQFFNHLQNYGYNNNANEFEMRTGIERPNTFAWLGWKLFGIGRPSFRR